MAFPTGWTKKCSLTIDNTKVSGSANLTNFPVLLTEANFPSTIFDNTQSAGQDLRFTSDSAGTTELAFEIVNWDTTNDKAEVWVKIPTVDYDDDTVFYVWYGNADATAYAVTGTYGRNAVWSGYKAVWHLQGAYDGTAGEVINSVGSLHGTATDATTQVGAKIGNGQTFTKANGNYIEIPDSAASALRLLATKYTIQMWVKPNVGANVAPFRVIQMEDADDFSGGYAIMFSGVGSILWSHNANDGDRNWTFNSGMSDGTYYKADFVYDQTNRIYYRDGGNPQTKGTTADLTSDNNDNFNIGRVPVYGQYYNGDIDEIRVIADALSADWLATEFANQNAPATFVTEGEEEDVGSTGIAASKRSINC